ncbi:MAG TPA: LEA type 2 family protein [Vicinamibacterales bacterium]|nr:LEA type 2 family protein [Vicinamibacterales bacterium]
MRKAIGLLALASLTSACATLGALGALGAIVQPPRFEEALDRPAEIRILPATGGRGVGGIAVRLWTRVTNPNPFGFTLSTLAGTLFLEDARAATAEFPLGLPLAAGRSEIVPIDISIGFSELPRLGGVLERAINRRPIRYRLDGTIAVEAGRFGTPVFGPMTLLRGTARGN